MDPNSKSILPPYQVFQQNNDVLVYDTDIAYLLLTKHRIVSKLIGASSFFHSQNKFSVLPLLLIPEAVTLGIEKGFMKLYSYPFSTNDSSHDQNQSKTYHHIQMQSKNKFSSRGDKNIRDISSTWKFPITKEERRRYVIFKDLYEKGFFITPALKFGSDFLVYENSPLMLHAKYMVYIVDWDERMKPSVIASLTRLALAVHKKILLAAVDQNENPKYTVLNYFSSKIKSKKEVKNESSFDKEAVFSGM